MHGPGPLGSPLASCNPVGPYFLQNQTYPCRRGQIQKGFGDKHPQAKQRRWALGVPLLAHGELLEQRGPQAEGYWLGRQHKTKGWTSPPWCSRGAHPFPGQPPVFYSLFCLILHRSPLHICILLKNGFILSALCHTSDFSFNVS